MRRLYHWCAVRADNKTGIQFADGSAFIDEGTLPADFTSAVRELIRSDTGWARFSIVSLSFLFLVK